MGNPSFFTCFNVKVNHFVLCSHRSSNPLSRCANEIKYARSLVSMIEPIAHEPRILIS